MGTAKRERQREGRQARRLADAAEAKRRQTRRTIRNIAILVVVVIIGALLLAWFTGDDDDSSNVATSDSTTTTSLGEETTSTTLTPATFSYGSSPCPAVDGSSPRTLTFTAPFQDCLDPTKQYTATFDTTAGSFTVALDTAKTPGTANNFVALSRYHYYDGTQLFRTDKSIGIIQGGSPTSQSADDPGPGYSLPDEGFDYASLPNGEGGPYKYAVGDLVMARTQGPNGAGAQFFLGASADIANLDQSGTYVRFGSTVTGVDVLEKILASHVDVPDSELGGHPEPPVTVNTITITES